MNRIRELRKEKAISAQRLAEMLHITPKHLYDLETGKRRLHEDVIKRLADIFAVSTDYLLSRTGERKTSSGPIAAHHEGQQGQEIDIDDILAEKFKEFLVWKKEREKKEK